MKHRARVLAGAAAITAMLHGVSWAAQDLTLGVSEGTSGGLDHAQVIAKYQGLANAIGQSLGYKVNVVFVREFKALEEGMKNGRFDFMMARPSDYPARGLRDYGYRYVASAKPEGQCHVVVPQDSPLKALPDLKGKRFVMPEQVSYMSRFCQAELRDQGIDIAHENVKYVREQGAVAFYLQNRFADVGTLASYSGAARQWEKDGHRVLHKSVAQPYFPLIAHGRFSDTQVAAVQKQLLALSADESGQTVLKTVGVQQFDTGTEKRLRDLLKWLGQ